MLIKFIYLLLDLTFYMKKFVKVLLSVIFVTLIVGSIQSVYADHLEPGKGVFKDQTVANIADTVGSKYQVHLQSVLRNGDGQLISVSVSANNAAYIPHEISDHVFDTLMGKKEIVTVDNIKYEKVQVTMKPTLEHRFVLLYPIFAEIPFTIETTAEREAVMSKDREHARWSIDYCAIFEGHDYACIPIFQAMVPNMTLEPDNDVIQYWTILRELN